MKDRIFLSLLRWAENIFTRITYASCARRSRLEEKMWNEQ